MNDSQRAVFYYELAKLLRAGLDLQRSLDLLLTQNPSAQVRDFLQQLQHGLQAHQGLATVYHSLLENTISPLEYSLIYAGEQSGKLESSCQHLASYYQQRHRSKQKMRSALIYPLVVLHLAIILPEIVQLFQSQSSTYWWLDIGFPLLLLWLSLLLLQRCIGWIQQRLPSSIPLERWIDRIPGIGSIHRHWALAHYNQVLHSGLLASWKFTDSLQLAGEASQSASLKHMSQIAVDALQNHAATLSEALQLAPNSASSWLRAIETAEVAGTLDLETQRWNMIETELANSAQERFTEWMPRVFYASVVCYVGYQVITLFRETLEKSTLYM